MPFLSTGNIWLVGARLELEYSLYCLFSKNRSYGKVYIIFFLNLWRNLNLFHFPTYIQQKIPFNPLPSSSSSCFDCISSLVITVTQTDMYLYETSGMISVSSSIKNSHVICEHIRAVSSVHRECDVIDVVLGSKSWFWRCRLGRSWRLSRRHNGVGCGLRGQRHVVAVQNDL